MTYAKTAKTVMVPTQEQDIQTTLHSVPQRVHHAGPAAVKEVRGPRTELVSAPGGVASRLLLGRDRRAAQLRVRPAHLLESRSDTVMT